MTIYYVIYFLTIFGVFVGFSKKSDLKNVLYFVISSLIVLSLGLRAPNMGTDTYLYLEHFANPYNEMGHYYDAELGYTSFVKIIRFFTANKYIFIFISVALPYAAILFFGRRYSTNPLLFLFLILSFSIGSSLYLLSFSMVRQIMAVGIWAIVIHLYTLNNYRFDYKIIIAIIFMLLFHTSSLLGVALLFLSKINISKRVMIVSCIIAYCAGLIMPKIFPYIENIAVLLDKEFYLTSRIDSFAFNPLALLPYLGIFFYILAFNSEEYCNSVFVKGLFISIVVTGFLYSIGTNLDRINLYFYLPAFVAVANGFNKPRPFIRYSVLIIMLIYFSYKYFISFDLVYPDAPLIPYRSFIS